MATAGDGPGAGPERAFCRPLPAQGPVRLDGEESRHLVRVRRAVAGDEVVLFDGEGATRRGVLRLADPRGAEVEILGPYPDREPGRRVVIASSPPEGARLDDLVATLGELGVHTWMPLRCERTPAGRLAGLAARRGRWDRRLREAAKVSGRSRLLRVSEPADLADLLARPGAAREHVLLEPDPAAPALPALLLARPDLPVLLVGPEGGFSPSERDAAGRAGVPRARLTVTALRVETAAAAAAAVALAVPPPGAA